MIPMQSQQVFDPQTNHSLQIKVKAREATVRSAEENSGSIVHGYDMK